MTKQEIRIMALVKARIAPDSIVIDIGAGTGSLSVEAALQAIDGKVFAVEREEEGIGLIEANAKQFGVGNITPVLGSAPEALDGLPLADVIFVGGSGGRLAGILHRADTMLKPGGRLVITAVTVDTLYHSLAIMRRQADYQVEAAGLQVTRIRQAGSSNMFQALNQVYVIVCTKGGAEK